MAETDWIWTISVEPPKPYAALAFEATASASGDITDPVVIGKLIGKHAARELIERLFEMDEEDLPVG